MLRIFVLLMLASSCASKFQVKALSDKGPRPVVQTDNSSDTYDTTLMHGLSARYKKAHSPSFAIIAGFYQLPKASPYGSAQIIRGYSYQTHLENIQVEKKEAPFVISPLDGNEAHALNNSLNSLLDMGVKLHEISMSDAAHIAKAEREALKNNKNIFWSEILAPSVDYLMSIDKAHSAQGPVLIGRVVSKDGRLLAFRVMRDGATSSMLSRMVLALFEDTINRL